MDEFDELLLRVIDEIIRYCLGDINASIVYGYFEKRSCPVHEIPEKLDSFSDELRNLMGFGRGQILGAPSILEEAIAEAICIKLGCKFDYREAVSFADYIRKLKRSYSQEKNRTFQIHLEEVKSCRTKK